MTDKVTTTLAPSDPEVREAVEHVKTCIKWHDYDRTGHAVPCLPGHLETLIRAAQSQPVSQWRPISEAPRDGTRMLAWASPCIEVSFVAYDEDSKCWFCPNSPHLTVHTEPTHFMPLPSPPTAEPKEGENEA